MLFRSAVSAQDNATSEIDLSENTTILEVEDNDRLNVEINKSDVMKLECHLNH